MSADPIDARVLAKVEAQKTWMLYRQAPGAIFVTAAAASGLLLTAGPGSLSPGQRWWGLLMAGLLLLRAGLSLTRYLVRPDPRHVHWWNNVYCGGVVVAGLLFGAWPIAFFAEQAVLNRLSGALILGAMAGGAVAVLSMRRWLAITYGGLLLLPAASCLFANGGYEERVAGVLGSLYWLTMVFSVSETHRSISRAIILAHSNALLREQTEQQRTALMQSNTDLQEAQQALTDNNRDLEQRVRERTAELVQFASHDALTGLLNRRGVTERINAALAAEQGSVVIHFVDLDGFKEINDAMGHAVGDQVLREVGVRLQAAAGEGVTVARWGGDEFVLLSVAGAAQCDPTLLAQSTIRSIAEPIKTDQAVVRIGACVGVALWPEDGQTLDVLLQHADMAVYAAKAKGPGHVLRYSSAMSLQLLRASQIKQALSESLQSAAAGLRLVYQPLFDARSGKLVGVEALLRWRHAVFGDVSPMEFIPMAERSGAIVPLGMWVLSEACNFAAARSSDDLPYVAVNVSAMQLLMPNFSRQVGEVLASSGLQPGRLVLELTESVFAAEFEQVLAELQQLKRMGIRIALDDFGTGYSSLAYLQRLPASILKIDGSFVRDVQGTGRPILEASLSMAMAFGLEVVAEGVENQLQLDDLRELGVHYAQGFLLARPTEAEEIDRLVVELRAAATRLPSAEAGLG